MPVYVPTPWSVGQRLKATALNVVVNAITELQAGSQRVYFEQVKTGVTVTGGVNTDLGAWTSASGFAASGVGVQVPTDGIYSVCLAWKGGLFLNRTFLELDVGGTIMARTGINDSPAVETDFSLTTMLRLSAGDLITPQRYATNTITAQQFTFRIARVAI